MSVSTLRQRIKRWGIAALLLVILAVGFFTRSHWWPASSALLAGLMNISLAQGDEQPAHDEHDDHPHASDDPNVLTVSAQAQATLGVEVGPLKRRDYSRSARIPGQVIEIRGLSNRDVTAGLSGVIARVYARAGEEVKPGDALFDVRLIHEEAVQLQLDLIDALAEQEVVDLETQRLTVLNRDETGIIARTRILQQQYKRRQLEHTIATRKQALILLGLSEEQVASLVADHMAGAHADTAAYEDGPRDPHNQHGGEHPLVNKVTIYAPQLEADSTGLPATYLVTELMVHPGEHVDSGQLLCRLADYRRLYIEGRAFERDLSLIRNVMDQGWTVSAGVELGNGDRRTLENLRILYRDPKVDAETRSARFYVGLVNARRPAPSAGDRVYVDWEFRPGQRMEVRVPVERFDSSLVVPVEAVARDGLENYVFQVSGAMFVRRPVTVLYRDENFAVLADDQSVFEGTPLALSGAYQLQLALLNRTSGPVGNSHAGHSH